MILVALILAASPVIPPPTGVQVSCAGRTQIIIDGVGIDVTSEAFTLTNVGMAPESLLNTKPKRFELAAVDVSLAFNGKTVEACSPKRCTKLGDAATEVLAGVGGPRAFVVAAAGSAPGLYRVTLEAPTELGLLVRGPIMALCNSGEMAMALMVEGPALVMASPATPAVVRYSLTQMLAEAMQSSAPAGLLARAAAVLARRDPELAAQLGARFATDASSDRRSAAALLLLSSPRAAATAAFWLLGHDAEPSVRTAAFEALRVRCAALGVATCDALAALFVDDPDPEIGWRARDQLLERRPDVALFAAPAAYKLDAVAILVRRSARFGPESVRAAVRLLMSDDDATVRRAALALAGEGD